MAYQDTPTASKRNAFCWHSWEPHIDWRNRGDAQSVRQTAVVEAKRAEGVDLSYVSGMGSSAQRDPASLARHAIRTAKEKCHGR